MISRRYQGFEIQALFVASCFRILHMGFPFIRFDDFSRIVNGAPNSIVYIPIFIYLTKISFERTGLP